MSTPSAELTATAVISLIESGSYPRDVILTIARGYLPLGQEDLVAVLAYLAASGDPEIAETAQVALADVPARIVVAVAGSETTPAQHLGMIMRASRDPVVLEAAIRNRSTPDAAVVELAGRADPGVQEVIVINQARILRAPEILSALLSNARLTPDARRRALETREEFFEKVRPVSEEGEPIGEPTDEIAVEPLDAIADLLQQAEQAAEPAPAGPTIDLLETEKKDGRARAVWARLQKMTVAEKVLLAFRGDRMIRMLLVRERNKIVATAAMRNPRITQNEVESIAGMRNVEEEVLRIIGSRREWMSKYPIMLTLARNPKAPVGLVIPLINRLVLRDLKGLKDDKGVSEIVRLTARKFYLARTQRH
ncbi:MAG TPA: hypothetical protein VGR02_21115 [Thermoanaerobaculia bacterium]|jgi:hypothetical protein|nr:hypothetical protein [Thermoanaerobaculia bacterium]